MTSSRSRNLLPFFVLPLLLAALAGAPPARAADTLTLTFHAASGLPRNTDIGRKNLPDALAAGLLLHGPESEPRGPLLGPTRIVRDDQSPSWEQSFSTTVDLDQPPPRLYLFVFDDKEGPCPICEGDGTVREAETCPKCQGSGQLEWSHPCRRCGGDGWIKDTFRWQKKEKCPKCHGKRELSGTKDCWRCRGDGKLHDLLKPRTCRICKGSGVRQSTRNREPAMLGFVDAGEPLVDLSTLPHRTRGELELPFDEDIKVLDFIPRGLDGLLGGDGFKDPDFLPTLRHLRGQLPFRWLLRLSSPGTLTYSVTLRSTVPGLGILGHRNVEGLKSWCERRGIQLATETVHRPPPTRAGDVVSTDPASGSPISPGDTLTARVASGSFPMPSLTGRLSTSARMDLLRTYRMTEVTQDTVEHRGLMRMVVSQEPAAGTLVTHTTPVRLTVGVRPTPVLPDLLGKQQAAAERWASMHRVDVEVSSVDSTEPAGTVLDQTPAPGTRLDQVEQLVLAVSSGMTAAADVPPPHGAEPGFTLLPDRPHHALGAPLEIRLGFPAGETGRFELLCFSLLRQEEVWSRHVDAENSDHREVEHHAPDKAGPYELRLLADEDVVAWARFAVQVPPVAGALSLPKDRFGVGEPLPVAVALPDDLATNRPWVALYRLEQVAPGGARIREDRLLWDRLEDRRTRLDLHAPDRPGSYELRLFPRAGRDAVVSRLAFSVEVPTCGDCMRLERRVLRVGEPFDVEVEVPEDLYWNRGWVGLYRTRREVPGGALIRADRLAWQRLGARRGTLHFEAPTTTGAGMAEYGEGRHELWLFDRDDDPYRLQTLPFEVRATPTPGALKLAKETYAAGEELLVEVALPEGTWTERPWVGIYRTGHRVHGDAAVHPGRLTWDRFEGLRARVRFEAPVEPGGYEVALFDRDASYYRLDRIAFEVEVPAAPGALSLPKETFRVGEPLPVTVKLPAGRYLARPWVGLYRQDRAVSGGAVQVGKRHDWKRFEGHEATLGFTTPTEPGAYELRLFDRHGNRFRIDALAFRVEATPVEGALELARRVFRCGEAVEVKVELPPGTFHERGWVGQYRPACAVTGGGMLRETRHAWKRFEEDEQTLRFVAPEEPGWMEFRLFDRHGGGRYLLDSIGCKVMHPTLPFPDHIRPPFSTQGMEGGAPALPAPPGTGTSPAAATTSGAPPAPDGGADQPDALTLARKALALLQAGRFAESAALYQQAVELDPDDHRFLHDLGVALYRQGEDHFDEAEACFRRAIEQKEDYYLAHKSYGAMLGRRGDLEQAMEELRRAEELEETDPMVYYNLALTELLLFERDQDPAHLRAALEWSKQGMELDPPPRMTRQHQRIERLIEKLED